MEIKRIASLVTSCSWITTILLLNHALLGRADDPQLWCLQCSWSNTQVYSTLNSTNGTTYQDCLIADLSHLSTLNPPTPIVNPLCTYEASKYDELLEGPCYDSACYAQGKSCIKWTMEKDGKLVNITRLCAMVGSDVGCYKQNRDGYDEEVCICNDQQYCNEAGTLSFASPRQLLCFQLLVFLVGVFWFRGGL